MPLSESSKAHIHCKCTCTCYLLTNGKCLPTNMCMYMWDYISLPLFNVHVHVTLYMYMQSYSYAARKRISVAHLEGTVSTQAHGAMKHLYALNSPHSLQHTRRLVYVHVYMYTHLAIHGRFTAIQKQSYFIHSHNYSIPSCLVRQKQTVVTVRTHLCSWKVGVCI